MSACDQVCPTGKRTKGGPNSFKGIKIIFTRISIIIVLEGRNKHIGYFNSWVKSVLKKNKAGLGDRQRYRGIRVIL